MLSARASLRSRTVTKRVTWTALPLLLSCSATPSADTSGAGGGAGGGLAAGAGGALLLRDGGPAAGGGGSPSGPGRESGGTPAPDAGTPKVSRVFQICGLATAGGSACPDVADYATCLGTACGARLASCFGTGFAADDFSGGVCEEYVSCVTGAADPCAATCDLPSATCRACLEDLVACFQHSSCEAPACASSPGGDGGLPATDAGGPADAGTLPPPPVSGTCADLRGCCEALGEPTQRAACLETLAAAEARAGEPDCAVVVSSYRAAGICGPPPAP